MISALFARPELKAAARAVSSQYSCAVLCKGGHDLNDAEDLSSLSGRLVPVVLRETDLHRQYPRDRLYAFQRDHGFDLTGEFI